MTNYINCNILSSFPSIWWSSWSTDLSFSDDGSPFLSTSASSVQTFVTIATLCHLGIALVFLLTKRWLIGRKKVPPFGSIVPLSPNAHWWYGHTPNLLWDHKLSLTDKYETLFGGHVLNKNGLGSIFLDTSRNSRSSNNGSAFFMWRSFWNTIRRESPYLVVTRCDDVQALLRVTRRRSSSMIRRDILPFHALKALSSPTYTAHERPYPITSFIDQNSLRPFARSPRVRGTFYNFWNTTKEHHFRLDNWQTYQQHTSHCTTKRMIKIAYDLSVSIIRSIRSAASGNEKDLLKGRFVDKYNNNIDPSSCASSSNKRRKPYRMIDMEHVTSHFLFDVFGVMTFGQEFGICKAFAEEERKITTTAARRRYFSVSDDCDCEEDLFGKKRCLWLRPLSHYFLSSFSGAKKTQDDEAGRRQELEDNLKTFYYRKIGQRVADLKANEKRDDTTMDLLHVLRDTAESKTRNKNVGGKEEVLSSSLSSAMDFGIELCMETMSLCGTTAEANAMKMLFGTTLMFALYAVALDKEVEARCLEEIYRVIGSSSSTSRSLFDFNIDDLEYCRAVVLETSRLYPAVPVCTVLVHPRGLNNEETNDSSSIILGGKAFPPGTNCILPIFSIQRDSRHFPKPKHFIPERWIQRKKDGSWTTRKHAKASSLSSSRRQRRQQRRTSTKKGGGGRRLSTESLRSRRRTEYIDGIPTANRDAFVTFAAIQNGGRSSTTTTSNVETETQAIQQTTIALAMLLRHIKMRVPSDYIMDLYYNGNTTVRPRHGMPMICTERCDACKQQSLQD